VSGKIFYRRGLMARDRPTKAQHDRWFLHPVPLGARFLLGASDSLRPLLHHQWVAAASLHLSTKRALARCTWLTDSPIALARSALSG
jgi:hypothetical protein